MPFISALVLTCAFAEPVLACSADDVDACKNADQRPGSNDPSSFVGGLIPDFLADLPVPNSVKGLSGVPSG